MTESDFAVSSVLTAVNIVLTGVYYLLLVGGDGFLLGPLAVRTLVENSSKKTRVAKRMQNRDDIERSLLF